MIAFLHTLHRIYLGEHAGSDTHTRTRCSWANSILGQRDAHLGMWVEWTDEAQLLLMLQT
jgi:hypothetical protein